MLVPWLTQTDFLHRFIWYSAMSHDSIFDEVLAGDQEKDRDRERDLAKDKFTLTECIVALVISLTLVTMIAIFLVSEIEPMVEDYGIPDQFMGLILVPLVEKAAEHLTSIDEARDDQMVSLDILLQIRASPDLARRILPCSTAWGLLSRQLFSMPHWSSLLAGLSITTAWT